MTDLRAKLEFTPYTYSRPCDHCEGSIVLMREWHSAGAWWCTDCACVWRVDFVLMSSGSFCPVWTCPLTTSETESSFEDAFDDCLRAYMEAESLIDEVVRKHPRYGTRLRSYIDLIRGLRRQAARVEPSPAWREHTRNMLLSQIAGTAS